MLDSVFPFAAWQDVTLNWNTGLSVSGARLTTTVVWEYIEILSDFGTCAVIPPISTYHNTTQAIAITVPIACFGVPAPFDLPYAAQVGALQFPESAAPMAIEGTDLTLRFGFSSTNCNGELEYRREKDWLETMGSAGFGEWFWSICPREKMVFNDTSNCVTYVCDGTFQLPDQIGQQTTKDIQDNIEQGIIFDAFATGLDVIGTVVEFVLMPVFVI